MCREHKEKSSPVKMPIIQMRQSNIGCKTTLSYFWLVANNETIQFNHVLQIKLMCFTFKRKNKLTKKPVNRFLQDGASAGI